MTESEKLVAANEAIVVQKESLESLTLSPQWGMLRGFIEDQVARRMKEITLTPVADAKDQAKFNHTLGECAMGNMIIQWMETRLQVTKDTVELYKQAISDLGDE
jgi:hypothetical protein